MFYISDIKEQAKTRLSGEWGSGILYAVGPGLVGAILLFIVQQFITMESTGGAATYQIISTVVNTVTGFMTINLIVQFVRFDPEIEFFAAIGPAKKLGKFFLYQIIFGIITIVIAAVFLFALFGSLISNFEVLMDIYSSTSPELTPEQVDTITTLVPMIIGFAFLLWISMLFITVRFMFVPYIIVHEDLGVLEAFGQSWEITKGKFFKIIGFELSFIGWYLLGAITCGLGMLYVIPYHAVATGTLYFQISGYDVRPSKLFEEEQEQIGQKEEADIFYE